jgi:hypothetical protein
MWLRIPTVGVAEQEHREIRDRRDTLPDSVLVSRAIESIRAAVRKAGAVSPEEPIALSRYVLCMTPAGAECLGSLTDTVRASFRFALRRSLRRCPALTDSSSGIVHLSSARFVGDSIEFFVRVDIPPTKQGEWGDQTIYRARNVAAARSSSSEGISLIQVAHTTYVPPAAAVRRPMLSDDTCLGQR